MTDESSPVDSPDQGEPPAKRVLVLPTLHPYLSGPQTLVVFLFIVSAFVLLAYRTEVAVHRIDQNIFEACQQRAEISKLTGTVVGTVNCEGLR